LGRAWCSQVGHASSSCRTGGWREDPANEESWEEEEEEEKEEEEEEIQSTIGTWLFAPTGRHSLA
jgi:ribosomal protein L12E/L44/L45/RPP1/RPP2